MELQKYRSEHLQNQLKLNDQLTNEFTLNQSVSVFLSLSHTWTAFKPIRRRKGSMYRGRKGRLRAGHH